MKRRKGLFIVLEGPDKSGKSTQAVFLVREMKKTGRPVVHTREPGGTSFAESVREILLDPARRVAPLAELFLYEASRAQHTFERIMPALEKGAIVISERYTLATLAYQGYGRGLPLPLLKRLNRIATGGIAPDLTIVLDIPEADFHLRQKQASDRLEREGADFRRKVREGYRKLASGENRIVLINGKRDKSAVRRDILRTVKSHLDL